MPGVSEKQSPEVPAPAGAPAGRHGGLALAAYLVIFCVYVLLNVWAPQTMAATTLYLGNEREVPLGGVNMAVIFGAGLILGAVVLALVELIASLDARG